MDFLFPKDLRVKQDFFYGRTLKEFLFILLGTVLLFFILNMVDIKYALFGCMGFVVICIIGTTTLTNHENIYIFLKRIWKFLQSTKFYQQSELEMNVEFLEKQ